MTSPAEGCFSRRGLYCFFCDLHIHTTASDGHLTSGNVVQHSLALGLRAISICDHDTMSGYLELAGMYTPGKLGIINVNGLEVVPGIEKNSKWEQRELHILGYFVDPLSSGFSQLTFGPQDSGPEGTRHGRKLASSMPLKSPGCWNCPRVIQSAAPILLK